MLNIAHRSASGYAPENTRAAFERAIAMGADLIETDIQLTRDGQLVLFHDSTVTRTSDSTGPVADYTLDELRSLDIGAWFPDGDFARERVMTLSELVRDFLPRIPCVLEIKDPRATRAVVEAVHATNAGNRIHITSFHWGALLDAQRFDPGLTLGFLCPVFDTDMIRRAAARGFRQICPRVNTLSRELVAQAHESGLIVRAYGISDRSQLQLLTDTMADGATINWPDWSSS